ncbi:class I SAM-dependent methyltransferase [Pseudoxanthomonas kaohsiungensis]|uniref:Class I SAM-dependent methyltransferase n=1 Tax=Pseudoxanthomonas kaohsiungensis TaxID=283923 RepID=A0ABW3LR05_9GAMM|nr:methyltransferase domain-containing protein [Pseudoxanthomonas kaohsiungensis]
MEAFNPMTIKQTIRNVARRLSNMRFIGKPVRIMAAVVRSPYYQQRQHVFETQQLPGMLHALSDVNGRQQIMQQGIGDALPVALRALRREQVELDGSVKAEIEALQEAHAVALRALRREQVEFNGVVKGEIETMRALQAQLLEKHEILLGENERLKGGHERLEGELALVVQAAQAASETAVGLSGIRESVEYLLGRVEFVRSELMFEMRYGARSHEISPGAKVEARVINRAKVDEARKRSSLRINMGCGHVALDGYVNVDQRDIPGVDVVADLGSLPFAAGEVDEIFSAHVIEHFPQEQLVRQLFPYWRGLIKPGGRFAAVVPDAQGTIEAYNKGEYSFDQLRAVFLGGQDYDGDFHYALFTPNSLAKLLEEAGFEDVIVLSSNRENAGCKEFEISAKRPNS